MSDQPNIRVITGAVSLETALAVGSVAEDYPYGRKLRCRMAYWVETKKGYGQRLVRCSTNPKVRFTEKWNAPHPGTYNAIEVIYQTLDDGHFHSAGIYNCPSSLEELDAFVARYGAAFDSYQQGRIAEMRRALEERAKNPPQIVWRRADIVLTEAGISAVPVE